MGKRYVSQLDTETQKKIKTQLTKTLTAEGLGFEEVEEGVRDGMDSKLQDLTDTIDIKPYL